MKTKHLLFILIAGILFFTTACKKEKTVPVIFNPVDNYIGGMIQFSGVNKPTPFYITFTATGTAYVGTYATTFKTTYTYIDQQLVVQYLGDIIFEFDMNNINKNRSINKFTTNKPASLSVVSAFVEKTHAADIVSNNYFVGQMGNHPRGNNIGIRLGPVVTSGLGHYYYLQSLYNQPLPEFTGNTVYFKIIDNIAFKADINGPNHFHFGVLFNNSLEFMEYRSGTITTATLKQKN